MEKVIVYRSQTEAAQDEFVQLVCQFIYNNWIAVAIVGCILAVGLYILANRRN